MMTEIKWDRSIWLFDVDDTLVETARAADRASDCIHEAISTCFDESTGRNVQKRFNDIFALMVAGLRARNSEDWSRLGANEDAYRLLLKRVQDLQARIPPSRGGYKKFSREVYLKIAADDLGLALTSDLVSTTIDRYWEFIAQNAAARPDALALCREVNARKRPIVFTTGSDARLRLGEDGLFSYDPIYSENYKLKRVSALSTRGFSFDAIVIGDPFDKPDERFYQKVLKSISQIIASEPSFKDLIVVGDSYNSDLAYFKENGAGLVVLVDPSRSELEVVDDGFIRTGNICEILGFLCSD